MKKIIFLCLLLLCFGIFFYDADCSEHEELGDRIYSGNPLSPKLATYVYLCRKDRNDKCRCSGNCTTGLSVGIITVDESNGDFIGFNPNNTNSIVWTASMSFGFTEADDRCCSSRGQLQIKYAYNIERYSTLGSEGVSGRQGRLSYNNLGYLYDEEGKPLLSPDVPDYRYVKSADSEFTVLHILRRAIFRWKVPGSRLSGILLTLGRIGIDDPSGSGKKILPRYNAVGLGGENCATFARRFLAEVGCSSNIQWTVRPVMAVVGFGGAATEGALIGSAAGPVGAVVGAGVGVLAEGALVAASTLCKMVMKNTPKAVVNFIMEFYAEALRNGYDYSDFRIIAHDRLEFERFKNSTTARGMFDTYKNFQLKSIREAVDRKVKMGKGKEKIFMKEDFQPDDGCVLI